MPNWTEKQRNFVTAKVAGKKNREAAIEAGYSASGASVQASKMMNMPHIRAAIAKAKRTSSQVAEDGDNLMPKEHYDDPLTFLEDMVNNKQLSMSMRSRAAEQLLPYKHARVGEKGKKEQRNDDAAKVAKNSKYAPKATPGALRLVK